MRRVIGLVIIAVVANMAPAAPARAEELGVLEPGDSRFWSGDYVDTDEAPYTAAHQFATTDGGHRLRVALDLVLDYRTDGTEHETADQRRRFTVTLLRDGEEIASGSNALLPWGYSVELYVCFAADPVCVSTPHPVPCGGAESACDQVGELNDCDHDSCEHDRAKLREGPSTGNWTVRVTADDVDGWAYRMRAALETAPPSDQHPSLVRSPNLRAIPPFELTLDCVPAQGSGAGARAGACAGEAGSEADGFTGCTALELAHNSHVRRCLRFSGGEEIAGAVDGRPGGGGPLDIRGTNVTADPVTGNITAQAVEVRSAPDGTLSRTPAGVMEYHESHGHWHYEGFLRYELVRVTDDPQSSAPNKVVLSQRDPGAKRGWNPANERMADWLHFNQGVNAGSSSLNPTAPRLFQAVGWGDFYEWPVEEQFVPIATDQYELDLDGAYLLRTVVDGGEQLVESDETDNSSYAYFEVTGDRSLRIIERGYGADPWDPHKVVETAQTIVSR